MACMKAELNYPSFSETMCMNYIQWQESEPATKQKPYNHIKNKKNCLKLLKTVLTLGQNFVLNQIVITGKLLVTQVRVLSLMKTGVKVELKHKIQDSS